MRQYLITIIALVLINFVFYPSPVLAHCDGIDGPVVLTAKESLKTGDVNLILIWIPEDAIVSRVLLKEKRSNITLFAFDKGQELSEHTAPFDAVVQVVEGKAQVSIDRKPYKLSAGQ